MSERPVFHRYPDGRREIGKLPTPPDFLDPDLEHVPPDFLQPTKQARSWQ